MNEQEKLLKELAGIIEMRRGSVMLQFFPRQRGGKALKKIRAPYPLFTRKRGGRTVEFRIHSEEELKAIAGTN